MPKDVWATKARRSAKQKAVSARMGKSKKEPREDTSSAASESPAPDNQPSRVSSELIQRVPSSSRRSSIDTTLISMMALAAGAVMLQSQGDQMHELEDIIAEQDEMLDEVEDLKEEGKRLVAEIDKMDRLRIREERKLVRAHRVELHAEQAEKKRLQRELDAMRSEAARMRQQTISNATDEVLAMLLRQVDVAADHVYTTIRPRVHQAIVELVLHLTAEGGVQTQAFRASMWALVQAAAGCPLHDLGRIVRQLSEFFGQPLPDDFISFAVPGPSTASRSANAGTEETVSKRGSFVAIQCNTAPDNLHHLPVQVGGVR